MCASIIFLDQLFDEAQELLKSSRDYIKWQASLDIGNATSKKASKITHEAVRIATRLSQVTVWLTLHKIIQEQEIFLGKSLPKKYHVLRGKTCLAKGAELDPSFPPRLRDLLRSTRMFYERILRLHEVGRKRVLTPSHPNRENRRVIERTYRSASKKI